ncbi:uncharacterized protein LOC112043208 [Bicyclus anynana]|uniref:Uncharacterized protein LOC112043208 n=1 Tax=Bicyclus anynana TaxID=110368 RepID=A0A6J1MIW8_BICAN|nr:uncharacterized protein LOC112043208 [Bicyclus anynana]
MSKKNIVKAKYVPLSSLRRAVELLETPLPANDGRCKRNLALVQQSKSVDDNDFYIHGWKYSYHVALRRAIYSHKWDQVAYLLKKSPIWEHLRVGNVHTYVRALTIVLMNHPAAKAQLLLDEYLHMVLACRSLEDKKALYKSVLSLTDKLYGIRIAK